MMVYVSAFAVKKEINIITFGADNKGRIDASGFFQKAITKLSSTGGGTILVPQGIYLFKYTVFVSSNVHIKGIGINSVIKANISISEGRCAFFVGDSHEWNFKTIEGFRAKKVRGWPRNIHFSDVAMGDGLAILKNDKRIVTKNSSIENLKIVFDYSGCGSNWGGYGIQFGNAADCSARYIWTINACQAIGIGSDVPPSSPGCVNINCDNIIVISPDPVRTYYSIGMIANSNNCSITNSQSLSQCTPGTEDGSVVSINFGKKCVIRNIKANVGKSNTSEGIFLNNAYGCVVENVEISNAKKAIAVSFTDYKSLLKHQTLPNIFKGMSIKNSDIAISLLSKFNVFSDFTIINCGKSIEFNINATNNIFNTSNKAFLTTDSGITAWFRENNTIN